MSNETAKLYLND